MSASLYLPEGNVKVAELNATQGSLLGFLHESPLTGWDLIRRVEGGLSRFWNVTPSHVYRELRALEERGLVEAGNPGVRDRVPFTITGAGRREFRHWIRRPPAPEQIRFPLLVSLWFGRHLDPAQIAEFVDDARGEHTLRLSLYESLEGDIDSPHHRAVIRFGVLYERAVLSWLEEVEQLGETS